MGPHEILEALRVRGVELAVHNGGLAARPERRLTSGLIEAVRRCLPGLIATVAERAGQRHLATVVCRECRGPVLAERAQCHRCGGAVVGRAETPDKPAVTLRRSCHAVYLDATRWCDRCSGRHGAAARCLPESRAEVVLFVVGEWTCGGEEGELADAACPLAFETDSASDP